MFTDKLDLGAPTEVSAKMELIDSTGAVVRDKDGEPGFIEFWGPESEATRRFRKHVQTQELLKQQKRERKGKKDLPNEAEVSREIEGYEALAIEGLALRVKSWRLLSSKGVLVDDEASKEKAIQLFSLPAYAFLKDASQEFVQDTENFIQATGPSS